MKSEEEKGEKGEKGEKERLQRHWLGDGARSLMDTISPVDGNAELEVPFRESSHIRRCLHAYAQTMAGFLFPFLAFPQGSFLPSFLFLCAPFYKRLYLAAQLTWSIYVA